ncbi:MAG: bacteriohemerythrin [Ignavibacteriaceae bacterium]
MEIIKWSDKYSVGHSLIDNQHKKLITLINELHTSMKEGRGKESLQKILDELVLYTKEHFSTEEMMMRKAGYSGYNEHKVEHDKLAEKVISLQDLYKAGKVPLTLDVMIFLKDWLINHIEGTDKKYRGKLS